MSGGKGAAAVRRGIAWQRACAVACRPWWPAADHSGTGPSTAMRRGMDITGVGDRILECTTEPMSALAKKMRQAEGAAARREFAEYYVWKKAQGEGPLGSWLVTRAGVLAPLLARLDRLEAWEAEQSGTAQDAWEAGYAAGYAARDGARI